MRGFVCVLRVSFFCAGRFKASGWNICWLFDIFVKQTPFVHQMQQCQWFNEICVSRKSPTQSWIFLQCTTNDGITSRSCSFWYSGVQLLCNNFFIVSKYTMNIVKIMCRNWRNAIIFGMHQLSLVQKIQKYAVNLLRYTYFRKTWLNEQLPLLVWRLRCRFLIVFQKSFNISTDINFNHSYHQTL